MYFLFKTEPEEFSFDDLIREGKTVWNGVKNPLAQKFIKSVKLRDKVFIYHTGKEKQIVGLAEVISEPYQYNDGYYVVDLTPIRKFKNPVKLKEIKNRDEFKNHYIVRMPRLSVMPVDDKLAKIILTLAES